MKKTLLLSISALFLGLLLIGAAIACFSPSPALPAAANPPATQTISLAATATLTPTVYLPAVLNDASPNGIPMQPSDLAYQGAFRLPDSPGMPENVNWGWANWASALTYYPDGDSAGPADGYPGSLFGAGHDQTQYISEVSIPVPVVSAGKNLAELNTAATLQDFANIQGGLFGYLEMPRVGLAYLPAQGSQSSGKLLEVTQLKVTGCTQDEPDRHEWHLE